MHRVAVLVHDVLVAFDLSVACEVLGSARTLDRDEPRPLYEISVCGELDAPMTMTLAGAATFEVALARNWTDAIRADTVVVLSPSVPTDDIPEPFLDVIRQAHAGGARVLSLCNGGFALAAAGLLDGRRAAVHWSHAAEFSARYPQVRADAAVLYVDHGDVITAAGGASGIDACLHLIRCDYGAAVAAQAARHSVLPLHREGEVAQITPPSEAEDRVNLELVLRWMEARLETDLTLATIAREARSSVRHLNRRFRAQTGTTPRQWLIRRRVQRAQELLETTEMSVEEVARRSGFGTATALRSPFRRLLGTTPISYRTTYRKTTTKAASHQRPARTGTA